MPKPRIQTRVDENVKGRVEGYAEERDMTKSEAMRHLIIRGLDYEAGELAATDGGVADRIDHLEARQQRREEIEATRTVVLLAGAAYIGSVAFGILTGPLSVLLGIVVLGALIYPAYQLRQMGGDHDE